MPGGAPGLPLEGDPSWLCDLGESLRLSGLRFLAACSRWAPGWDSVCAPRWVPGSDTQRGQGRVGRCSAPDLTSLSGHFPRMRVPILRDDPGVCRGAEGAGRAPRVSGGPARRCTRSQHVSRRPGKARLRSASERRTAHGLPIGRRLPAANRGCGAELRAPPDAQSLCGPQALRTPVAPAPPRCPRQHRRAMQEPLLGAEGPDYDTFPERLSPSPGERTRVR